MRDSPALKLKFHFLNALIGAVAAITLLPIATLAQSSITLDAGKLDSRLSVRESPGFSLLSNSGLFARAEASSGFKSFDFLTRAELKQYRFQAPSSRTLINDTVQTTSLMGALRLKTPYAWIHAGYQTRPLIVLAEAPATVYAIGNRELPVGVLGAKFLGFGNAYRLTLELEAATPLGTAKDAVDEEVKLGLMYRGATRVEFGSRFRWGFAISFESQNYSSPRFKYEQTDLGLGLTFAFGGGRSKSSGGSSEYYSPEPPRYPY